MTEWESTLTDMLVEGNLRGWRFFLLDDINNMLSVQLIYTNEAEAKCERVEQAYAVGRAARYWRNTMANLLTTDQIQSAYRVASQVMDQHLPLKQGVAQLVTEGVGATYAQDLINVYRYMRLGRCYHRTINVEATDYFLRQLFEDGGPAFLLPAINATHQHINYYEEHQKLTLHRKRKVVADLEHLLGGSLISHLAAFDKKVQAALADSSDARKARLAARAHFKPERVVLTSTIFVRNPDVVAEALHRAAGVCEECNQAAPFTRRSNGTPYLEIHHRIRLADGGLDTLENTVALCPNCHRASHYG